MDQEAFRKLLETPRQGSAAQRTPIARASLLRSKAAAAQQQTTDTSKSGFKPRKIKKKADDNYRNRAEERRLGVAGDFAELSSRTSRNNMRTTKTRDAVEARRRYLGGDSDHSILVKGLDFALLEQNRARAAATTSVEDDELLEDAFRGVDTSPASAPPDASSKKRTREDIVRELKRKRAKGVANGPVTPTEDKTLEEAKREGKFKPIGFKPIGSSSSKAKDAKEKDGVRKKKKRKLAEGESGKSSASGTKVADGVLPESAKKDDADSSSTTMQLSEKKPSEPEFAPPVEDFDIFAEAGDYEGVNFDDEDDEDDDDLPRRETAKKEADPLPEPEDSRSPEPQPRPRRKWFDDDEPPSPPPDRTMPAPADAKGKGKAKSFSPGDAEDGDVAAESERVARLAPLASSALPSIRDILAADSALETEQKRKARKEKRKPGAGGEKGEGKKVSAEAKLNRDYQKLKSFTDKKKGS
ncbi:hypothetical protein DFH11DRAFT_1725221 [Phellopilus nigrolimitatus]|nr:hypothetical protein DFH11DRAFT_1725221 [Phellopilus nigrolimitatus]